MTSISSGESLLLARKCAKEAIEKSAKQNELSFEDEILADLNRIALDALECLLNAQPFHSEFLLSFKDFASELKQVNESNFANFAYVFSTLMSALSGSVIGSTEQDGITVANDSMLGRDTQIKEELVEEEEEYMAVETTTALPLFHSEPLESMFPTEVKSEVKLELEDVEEKPLGLVEQRAVHMGTTRFTKQYRGRGPHSTVEQQAIEAGLPLSAAELASLGKLEFNDWLDTLTFLQKAAARKIRSTLMNTEMRRRHRTLQRFENKLLAKEVEAEARKSQSTEGMPADDTATVPLVEDLWNEHTESFDDKAGSSSGLSSPEEQASLRREWLKREMRTQLARNREGAETTVYRQSKVLYKIPERLVYRPAPIPKKKKMGESYVPTPVHPHCGVCEARVEEVAEHEEQSHTDIWVKYARKCRVSGCDYRSISDAARNTHHATVHSSPIANFPLYAVFLPSPHLRVHRLRIQERPCLPDDPALERERRLSRRRPLRLRRCSKGRAATVACGYLQSPVKPLYRNEIDERPIVYRFSFILLSIPHCTSLNRVTRMIPNFPRPFSQHVFLLCCNVDHVSFNGVIPLLGNAN
ncbi:hypothetical protein PFISCL1PPCAC_4390 [Pristionchus fissidentatus]|uniref:Uncharacterized protein n=1 Tax=Pristionchus fissidentatus TaxID=1538716 RepID=A0AAV5V4B5_9BILA|nr:hypothetical protein PFISCL1PPCAC_4390 [Pristionchus fissidentatus]